MSTTSLMRQAAVVASSATPIVAGLVRLWRSRKAQKKESPPPSSMTQQGVQDIIAVTLQPAAPFFGIWGIVFAGEALYVLAQAAPGWDADAMLNESGLWHAGALIATNAWGAIFQGWPITEENKEQQQWTLAGVLASGAALQFKSLLACKAFASALPSSERALFLAVPSLFGGWLTVAAAVNTACAIRCSGVTALAPDTTEPFPSSALLALLTAVGVAATNALDGNPFFAGGIVWGLLGGALANLNALKRAPPGVTLKERKQPILGAQGLLAGAAVAAAAVSAWKRGDAQKWVPHLGALLGRAKGD